MIFLPKFENCDKFIEELNLFTNQWAALGYIKDEYLIRNLKPIKSKLDEMFIEKD